MAFPNTPSGHHFSGTLVRWKIASVHSWVNMIICASKCAPVSAYEPILQMIFPARVELETFARWDSRRGASSLSLTAGGDTFTDRSLHTINSININTYALICMVASRKTLSRLCPKCIVHHTTCIYSYAFNASCASLKYCYYFITMPVGNITNRKLCNVQFEVVLLALVAGIISVYVYGCRWPLPWTTAGACSV